jgi:hypothetical protein
MNNIISAITDFLTVAFLGTAIFLFAGEIKLEALKGASNGSTKLGHFTEKMTGSKLDLSDERVYGTKIKKKRY